MKVSIWQQFSSNHSANFTTVGHFESAEWAEMVATEVKEMLSLIAWWHEQLEKYDDSRELVRAVTTNPKSIVGLPDFFQKPEILQMLYASDFEPLTPPEAYFCQKYQLHRWRIDRNTSLDWVSSQYALKYVTTWKNLVIIEPDASTWAGSHPFHTILEKLGGNVASSLEGELYIALHLCWKMPTIQAANDLVAYMLQPKLRAYQGIKIDGMGYGYIFNDADLVANQNEIVLKNFRPSYYNVATHSSISFVDALQKNYDVFGAARRNRHHLQIFEYESLMYLILLMDVMGVEPTSSSYFVHSSVELQLPYSAELHSVGLSVEILMYTANLYCIYDPDFNRVSTFRGALPTELHTLVRGNICFYEPFS